MNKSKVDGSNVDMGAKSETFNEHNTIVLPYFGQIPETIQFMFQKFKIQINQILKNLKSSCEK